MATIARSRLAEERKQWRKDHPIGFFARPCKKEDGSTDLLKWEAGIPGKVGTPWESAVYRMRLEFQEDFPSRPPECYFDPVIFHPNIYPSGRVCLNILDESKQWKPSITLKQILLGVQELLDNPNNEDPAQSQACTLLKIDPAKYNDHIRKQAKAFADMARAVESGARPPGVFVNVVE